MVSLIIKRSLFISSPHCLSWSSVFFSLSRFLFQSLCLVLFLASPHFFYHTGFEAAFIPFGPLPTTPFLVPLFPYARPVSWTFPLRLPRYRAVRQLSTARRVDTRPGRANAPGRVPPLHLRLYIRRHQRRPSAQASSTTPLRPVHRHRAPLQLPARVEKRVSRWSVGAWVRGFGVWVGGTWRPVVFWR
jgi:hypothetical protein